MQMVDCYEDVDYVHLVTEKYTGDELFDKIIDNTTDGGCYSEHKAACIIKSLLEVVAYLHENNIIHRDIKSQKIFHSNLKMKKITSFLTLVSHEDTRMAKLP